MKNWSRKFNPHKTAFRTPSLFRLNKIILGQKIKAQQFFKLKKRLLETK